MATVPLTATYSAGGTYGWVCPPGVTSVACACTGAGGGGGGANATSGSQGGGGGGGEAAYEPALPVTPGTSYLVIVGTGGLGGNFATGALSTAGGQSSFAGDHPGTGGSVAVVAHGGDRGTQGTTGAGQGGGGGTGSTNSVSAAGGAGSDGTVAGNGGGGGGGAGISPAQGFPGGNSPGSGGGTGGLGTFPGGAGAAGAASAGNGSTGTGPGGGGSGALSTGTGHNGGAGADGQVVITWTMTDPITLPNDTVGGTWKFTAPLGVTAVKAEAVGAGAGGFASSSGAGATCGCSAFTPAYGSPRSAAATTFDNRVGRPMALASQVTYYDEEKYPSAATTTWTKELQDLAAMGAKVIATFKCSRRAVVAGGSALTAQQNAFAAGIAYILSIPGINLGAVCIGNEPGINGLHGPFGDGTVKDWNLPCPYGTPTKAQTAANFLAYWAAFVPTAVSVLAGTGVPVWFKPTVTSQDMSLLMFPGGPSSAGGCDGVFIDWYATDQPAGSTPFGASNMEGLCDQAGVGLGLGEWGAAGGSNGPSLTTWNSYITAMANGFTNRFNNAKKVIDAVYFGGLSTTGQNTVTSSSDYKVPGIQQIYDLFAGSHPGGGAGGGGGEYAAEASLAVTGQRSYTLVVGNAGTAGTSGTSTTVAGDSVTVTAHPGLAATSGSAGGAGGTGSSNTTHNPGGAGGAGGGQGGAGGGGGGSGGSAAAGTAGTAGTATTGGGGGVAVTGGGPGGKGGGPAGNGLPPVAGPGGGGGARGATGANNAPGSDGQITLSSFTTGTGAAGSCALGPLAATGTATINAGNATLAPMAASGTASVGGFTFVQKGATAVNVSTTTTPGLTNPSTAGTMLVVNAGLQNQAAMTTAAPGWAAAVQRNGGGASGRSETWWLPGHMNPGGITSVAFTTSGDSRMVMSEYATPANTTQALNGTPGTFAGTTSATIGAVNYAGSAGTGDLAILGAESHYSVAPVTTTQVDPAGWTKIASQGGNLTNGWGAWYQTGLSAGTQTATETLSSNTNLDSTAGTLAVFTVVPVNTTTGSAALGPLAAAGTGTAGVPAGTVVSNGSGSLGPLAAQSPALTSTFPEQPLPVTVELLINNAWTDITSYVYVRDGITISGRGRPNEASTAQPAQCTLTLNNRGGDFSPQNPDGQFYPYLVRNIQLRISVTATTSTGANYSGYRFWGQVPAWPPQWDLSGADVYVPVTAVGVLQRMQQSKYSASPIARYYTNIMNQALNASPGTVPIGVGLVPAAYWPCEDSAPTQIPALKTLQAASFASGLPGGSPMTWAGGTIGLASDSSVLGSQPFAQLSGSVWPGTPGAFSSGGITFSTPGTYTWTCPSDVNSVKAECWGAGGGGANGVRSSGGGGGEYARENSVAVTPGNDYTIVVGASGRGGPGDTGAGTQGTQGDNGFRSTFTGDNVTVIAHGGDGGHTTTGLGGAGGTGSTNTTHHDGGDGGPGVGAGTRSVNGGSGGGSSGGTAAAGHTGGQASGNTGAAGGTAVTDGGPGGRGGNGGAGSGTAQQGFMPSPGPGGGGGGGGYRSDQDYGRSGGGGQPGQVILTYGLTSVQPPAIVLRALIDVPAGGGLDGMYLLQADTTGSAVDVHLIYHTGGNLELAAKNKAGAQMFTSGSVAFGVNGNPMLVSVQLTFNNILGSLSWKLTALQPGADAVVKTASGNADAASLGFVTRVGVNNAPGKTDTGATGVGHVSVQYKVDPILNLSQALNAYTGELAADRFKRLCKEQNVPVRIFPSPGDTPASPDTPAMGPQPAGLLVDLLQDCENTDLGLMFERRDAFGLGYITRAALQNQPSAATLDYAARQLGNDLTPTNDEQLIRNDIVATRASGGTSYEAIQMTGPLSVLDPPGGVGLYQYQVTVNVQADTQLAAFAQWLLALGTLDEYRYPQIVINLMRPAVRDGTFGAVAGLDIGDMITIGNPPAWLPPGPINQLCYGFTETINAYEWTITVNAVPADPYISTGTLPSW